MTDSVTQKLCELREQREKLCELREQREMIEHCSRQSDEIVKLELAMLITNLESFNK